MPSAAATVASALDPISFAAAVATATLASPLTTATLATALASTTVAPALTSTSFASALATAALAATVDSRHCLGGWRWRLVQRVTLDGGYGHSIIRRDLYAWQRRRRR